MRVFNPIQVGDAAGVDEPLAWLVRALANREPFAFRAGDANVRRYVFNAPQNHVDPSGLEFQVDATKHEIRLKVELFFNWKSNDRSGEKWGGLWALRKNAAKLFIKQQIEEIWNDHPFRIFPGKDGDKAPGGTKGLVPKVEISFATTPADRKPHHFNVEMIAGRRGAEATKPFTRGDTMYFFESDLAFDFKRTLKRNGKDDLTVSQAAFAHEFGHLIGLDHPGSGIAKEFMPDTRDDYTLDFFALMGSGNDLRASYFKSWVAHLNGGEATRNFAQWVVKTDKSHPKYKDMLDRYRAGVVSPEEGRFLSKENWSRLEFDSEIGKPSPK